jgi:hypothetical protein
MILDPDYAQNNGLTEDETSDKLLLAEIYIGESAKAFVESEIGRYLIGRANEEIAAATETLTKVLPWRRKRINQLQNQIYRAKSIKQWLVECINSADVAFQELDRKRSEGTHE